MTCGKICGGKDKRRHTPASSGGADFGNPEACSNRPINYFGSKQLDDILHDWEQPLEEILALRSRFHSSASRAPDAAIQKSPKQPFSASPSL
jgi:hypothetical protein